MTADAARALPLPEKLPDKRSAVRRFFSLELLDNRYPALHGLRVLAIISVVQYHVSWIFIGEQGIIIDRDFFQASITVFFGMDLFFILSGFLIGSILNRSLEVSGTQNIRRFYIRRVFRTFPSYWVVLTVLALAFPLTPDQRAHLPYEYIYATNFMPLSRPAIVMFWGWSLSLEEQFYLAVPVLFFVLYRLKSERARMGVLAALMGVALAVRLVIFFRGRPWDDFVLYGAIYFRTHTRFDTLVAGILLAFLHRRYKDALTRWLVDPFHRALLALPALALLWFLLRPAMFGGSNMQLVHMFSWGTATSLMYLPTLLLLLHTEGPIQRFLGRPFFRRAATLGYGVYLVHIPIIDHVVVPTAHRLQEEGHSMLWVWPASLTVTLLLSFVIAYAMHVVIEKPSLYLRERLGG